MDGNEPGGPKPRLVGINHVALEVGSVEEALAFYGRIFDFELRGRGERSAFIDMGDQFIALAESAARGRDNHRHIGLVVDDRASVKARARAAGADVLETGSVDFRDPWGNRVQVVDYADIQFTKADHVLEGMGLDLSKTEGALKQLRDKGLAPPGGE